MRISNLKFINTTMFVFAFIVSGLFLNIQNIFAVDTDITPPTVISSDPVDSSINVSVGIKPKITFSEALNPTSVTSGSNIELRDYASATTSVLATLVLSEGDTVVTFNTTSNLDYSKQYYFFIGTGVKDVAGNSFAGNTWYHANRADHEFTTESIPATLSSIAITTPANKLSYTVGDLTLDITGLVVTGTYSDGTTKVETVTLNDISGFNSTIALASQTLTITIGGKTATYNISISEASDPVAIAFKAISTTLNESGISSNLGDVNSLNYSEFSGLYFEKSIDGVKMGRITFTGALDLSSKATQDFLTSIGSKLDMSKTGMIGLDFSDNTPTDLTDDPSLKGIGATIIFYNLDKLGFTSESTASDILSFLVAMDDLGNIINKAELLTGSGTYFAPIGACMVGGDCYTFEIPIAHFTKYTISENSAKKEEVNNGPSGSYIQPITNTPQPILISCAPNSGHIYDVNTGKLCTNDTSIHKPVYKQPKVAIDITNKPLISNPDMAIQVGEIAPLMNEPIDEIANTGNEEVDGLSGREVLMNSISASVGKIGLVFKGSMFIWIILLIIIILGGGAGVYSLLNMGDKVEVVEKPIVPITPNPTITPNPKTQSVNTPNSNNQQNLK